MEFSSLECILLRCPVKGEVRLKELGGTSVTDASTNCTCEVWECAGVRDIESGEVNAVSGVVGMSPECVFVFRSCTILNNIK